MFAVTGWSVSSSDLKKQTVELDGGKWRRSGPDPDGEDHQSSKTRKRKRRDGGQMVVNQENVSELWEKHIHRRIEDGTTSSPTQQQRVAVSKEERFRKRRKSNAIGVVPPEKIAGAESVAVIAREVGSETGSKKKPKQQKQKQQKQKNEEDDQALPSKRKAEDGDASDLETEVTSSMPVKPISSMTTSMAKANDKNIQLTTLQASMRDKLTSARFRHLNQNLYTTSSSDSFRHFQQHPELFEEYHEGFRRQVASWPENPVDGYIRDVEQRGMIKNREGKHSKAREMEGREGTLPPRPPLPRTNGICTIADLGCGDAKLARFVQALSPKSQKKLKINVLSYDLHSPNPLVTVADVAHLPLPDGSVDMAIFCLALMGTNWIRFIEEAYRVLRWKGELWIAEIKSRFVGKPSPLPVGIHGDVDDDDGPARSHQRSSKNQAKKQKQKQKQKQNKKTKNGKSKEEDDNEDAGGIGNGEGIYAEDTPPTASAAAVNKEPDLSAFLAVLRRRGFILSSSSSSSSRNPTLNRHNRSKTDDHPSQYLPIDIQPNQKSQPTASATTTTTIINNKDNNNNNNSDNKMFLKLILIKAATPLLPAATTPLSRHGRGHGHSHGYGLNTDAEEVERKRRRKY